MFKNNLITSAQKAGQKLVTVLSKKHVGLPLLVVSTIVITVCTTLVVAENNQATVESNTRLESNVASLQTNSHGSAVTANGSNDSTVVTASNSASTTKGQPGQNTQGNQNGASNSTSTTPSSRSTTSSSKPGTAATPAPSPTPTPTPSPTPVRPSGNITFSADGCYVTMSGAPGWVLNGTAEGGFYDGEPHKGGPLGNPDGYVMPASGSTTVLVGYTGYSWASWRLTAVLSDQSGNVMATKVVFIDAAAPACP